MRHINVREKYMYLGLAVLMFLIFVVSAWATLGSFNQYGWTYEETTIINGVESTVTVNLVSNIFGGVLFLVFTYSYLDAYQLCIQLELYAKTLSKKEEF